MYELGDIHILQDNNKIIKEKTNIKNIMNTFFFLFFVFLPTLWSQHPYPTTSIVLNSQHLEHT